ncbi:hypothetical protein ACFPM0_09245 [Pseudonocardia sulfidoxydans]|uniref:hypothetical protein n=1 Tax=Pseudonocardia sulfidoxydans TaxID=54011 RepID=UPI003621EA1E
MAAPVQGRRRRLFSAAPGRGSGIPKGRPRPKVGRGGPRGQGAFAFTEERDGGPGRAQTPARAGAPTCIQPVLDSPRSHG